MLAAQSAAAEPVVVASGAYPEGLLWHGGRMYFAEMGADRVSVIENGGVREFWRDPRCGPTSIAAFGSSGFLVNCHLGREVVEVTAEGATGRRFRDSPTGTQLQNPNASTGDGQGGVFFSDPGAFDLRAPASGRVYHLTAAGVMTEIVRQLKYANGVGFEPATRTLYVSEHLARRVLSFTLDGGNRIAAHRVLVDFAQVPAIKSYSYPLAGPDGIALRPGLLAVAEYGEGRVHLLDRSGRHLNTLKVPMPFVDTVAWDGAGNLYAGGAFQNARPPYDGAVVRFAPGEWQNPPQRPH
jgi:sugar lactone lactonase YvrE